MGPAGGRRRGRSFGGSACYYHLFCKGERVTGEEGRDIQQGSFLGPDYSVEEIKDYLEKEGIPYHHFSDEEKRFDHIAEMLDEQKVIGVFSGRMEFGPRALGHRSIIADPRSEKMQVRLNLSIKYRESFRPFAPAVIRGRCSDYFDVPETGNDLPYMLICADVLDREDLDFDMQGRLEKDGDLLAIVNRKRSEIPAVTHVDYSARVQTVDEETNPFFYSVLKSFEKRTGCGVVINTSFNVRGEPIVCSPEDAYHCFMNTEMDMLVLRDFVLYKDEQPEQSRRRDRYELD